MSDPAPRMPVESFYDRYWNVQDRGRAEARSRERAGLAVDLLSRTSCGKRLLDLGCGPGWTLETFRAAGFVVAGVDASRVAVEETRRRGFRARQLDLEREPLEGLCEFCEGDCDVAVALEVLEHLNDPLGLLLRLRSFLRPGAHVVVSLPNEIHLLARLEILRGRLPFGGHDDPHLRHFDRRQALMLFRSAGYRILEKRPVSILPPRWGAFRRLAAPAVRLLPGSLSLATVYLLQGDDDGR